MAKRGRKPSLEALETKIAGLETKLSKVPQWESELAELQEKREELISQMNSPEFRAKMKEELLRRQEAIARQFEILESLESDDSETVETEPETVEA